MITEAALLQFLGRLHPVLLHLPIGLWLGIAVLEFGGSLIRRRAPRATIATLAWLAAIGAALTAGAGWLLAQEDYSGRTLELHRWLGIAAAAVGLLAAVFAGLAARRPFQLLLLAEVGTLLAAGHFGSEMTHGAGWLTEPFAAKTGPAKVQVQASTATVPPTGVQPTAAAPALPQPAVVVPDAPPSVGAPTASDPPAATPTFAASVLPILTERCSKCHGESKQKGKLALHTQAAIELGGENGPAFVAGKPTDSELLRRIALPLDDEDHMPPEEKPQPTTAEIAVLHSWIAAGSPFAETFAIVAVPAVVPHAVTPTAVPTVPTTEPASPVVVPTVAPIELVPANTPKKPVERPKDAPKQAEKQAEKQAAARPQDTTDTVNATSAAAQPAALAAGITALRARLVHVARVAADADGLWVDFAPIAKTMTEAEARTLLLPVAAHVQDLGLARVPIGDDLLPLCAGMPMLQSLDLRGTRVTARGLLALRDHAALARLVLAETRLGDDATDVLLQMPALRRVHLWHAGLGDAALLRLRQRQDLAVDTGEVAATPALETEPPPFADDAAATAIDNTATVAVPPEVAAALRPINDVCPVSGKPVDEHFVVVHEQRAIGFCCPNCPKQFWTAPAKFPIAAR